MPQGLLADGADGQVDLGGDAGSEKGLEPALGQVQSAVYEAMTDSVAGGVGGQRAVAAQEVRQGDAVRAGGCVGGQRRVEVRDPSVLYADAI